MICPTCGKDNSRKTGFSPFKHSREKRYQCKYCNRVWHVIGKNPKLLYLDIETTHIEFKGWRIGKQYVSADRITQDWILLAWAAKWVCTNSMFSMVLSPRDIKNHDDTRLVKELWKLFDEADILIGHNSDQFDIKRMNWRFELCGLRPPRPYRTVDTFKVAKRTMGATSKSLDFLARELGVNEGKLKMHDEDWDACEAGDPDALRKMRRYNEHDVLTGESVYLRLRKWDKNHPNLGLYYETDIPRCKNCGSTDLVYDDSKPFQTAVNSYLCWTCVNCGANGRTPESVRYDSPLSDETTEERKLRTEENREKRKALMR